MIGGDDVRRAQHPMPGDSMEQKPSKREGSEDAARHRIDPEAMLARFGRQDRSERLQSDEDVSRDEYAPRINDAVHSSDDPAPVAAAVLIGRTLAKDPDASRRIVDEAPVLVVECSSEAWIEPTAHALMRCFGSRPSKKLPSPPTDTRDERRGAIVIKARAGRSCAHPNESTQAARALRGYLPLIGIVAPGAIRLPEELERACEGRIVLGTLEPFDLTLVVRQIVGSVPSTTLCPELAAEVGPMDLRIALHPARGPEGALERLRLVLERRRTLPPASKIPRLSELHGYGAAAEWGLAAAADLVAYGCGQHWSSCEQGALLTGVPGVGKTLLAAAIAREANVPFLVGSLAQWQAEGEAHLGTTLKAMRTFFGNAKKVAPCVALVDELDSFGDRRKLESHNHHYGVQVINGFLECLDGDGGREGVLLVGATNNPGWIDPAILRSGRFDRQIAIEAPSLSDLAAILRYHLGQELPGIDLLGIARRGLGGTGADCAAWVRRARGRARRAGQALKEADLMREIAGATGELSIEEDQRVAIHEAGHAVVARVLGLPVGDLVLRSPGHGGDGYMGFRMPKVVTRKTMENVLAVLMAGRAAEIIAFDSPSAGASTDLALASKFARDMHLRWGLCDVLAVQDAADTAPMIDLRIERALRSASSAALRLLAARRRDLERLAEALLERRSLTSEDIELILIRTGRRSQAHPW
ncbi:Peptidase family M41 [Methylobacterium sp. 190mf]|uniref:AAA family ATPase n=1 Tax=Methylobacterium sp. 190mf TaxID=1761798 RepID=UPI00089E43C8|nr:AAA family ATPase [Methylobacterium sp. 190mf]SEG52057.1 Peptidase family M41 [Methylobacterium sp. 190mf]